MHNKKTRLACTKLVEGVYSSYQKCIKLYKTNILRNKIRMWIALSLVIFQSCSMSTTRHSCCFQCALLGVDQLGDLGPLLKEASAHSQLPCACHHGRLCFCSTENVTNGGRRKVFVSPFSCWPLVGNEGMNPQYTNVKVDSLIPY